MGILTFALNLTLDGCCDHRAAIPDDELHDYFTQLMDAAGAMLWGRTTYEMMESAWPAVARDEKAPRAMREWAQKLEAKPKYVVSASRRYFPWNNTFRVTGDLHEAVTQLKEKTPRGVLVGSHMLAACLLQEWCATAAFTQRRMLASSRSAALRTLRWRMVFPVPSSFPSGSSSFSGGAMMLRAA